MDRCTIACDSCEHAWAVDGSFSFYEREALESRPCPECGAYTLSLQHLRLRPDRTRRLALETT